MPIRAITLIVGICCGGHRIGVRLATVKEQADSVSVGFGDEGEGFDAVALRVRC